jgi:octaprenyl-diphosphate synthase
MSQLDSILKIIEPEMKAFDRHFAEAVQSRAPLLDRVTKYILKRKGKQMRPMLVLLSAKMLGNVQDSTHVGASLIELLHTATLVHDDVVDDAYERRGFFSINALWKNKIAVLVGDFLLSKGLLLSLKNEQYSLLQIVSTAVELMSEGELIQMEKARRMDITEDVYFQIIRAKTASLMAACCAVGAASVGRNNEEIEKMRQFGEYLGMAFQIKDDLLDLDHSDTGKPKYIDIKERKMTLPLIYALNQSNQRRKMVSVVKRKGGSSEELLWLVEEMIQQGGIDYARLKMNDYQEKALEILQTFPNNEARKGLEDLTQFVLNRSK